MPPAVAQAITLMNEIVAFVATVTFRGAPPACKFVLA